MRQRCTTKRCQNWMTHKETLLVFDRFLNFGCLFGSVILPGIPVTFDSAAYSTQSSAYQTTQHSGVYPAIWHPRDGHEIIAG